MDATSKRHWILNLTDEQLMKEIERAEQLKHRFEDLCRFDWAADHAETERKLRTELDRRLCEVAA